MKLPIALQLYTVRDETGKDMLGTLEKVAGMGYGGVEFAGFGGIPAKKMKAELERLGLKPIASHVSLQLLTEDLDAQIEYHLEIGCKSIICPHYKPESMEDFPKIADSFNSINEKCKARGIRFGYHNHDFEFKRNGGEYYLDALFKRLNSDVFSELDTGWAFYAGVDPAEYMGGYKGRCPFIHIKDFLVRGERSFTELGNGIVDIKAIIKAAKELGTEWLIVEQDVSSLTSLESAKINYENLSKMV